jgi:hypothetical protein
MLYDKTMEEEPKIDPTKIQQVMVGNEKTEISIIDKNNAKMVVANNKDISNITIDGSELEDVMMNNSREVEDVTMNNSREIEDVMMNNSREVEDVMTNNVKCEQSFLQRAYVNQFNRPKESYMRRAYENQFNRPKESYMQFLPFEKFRSQNLRKVGCMPIEKKTLEIVE